MDFVMLQQLGIGNVVAPCGTALTVQQVRLIKKFTDNVTLMNDGDGAGIHASLKDIDLILYEGLNVKVVLLPEGEDPDSFSRAHTLEEVQDYIAGNERDFLDFKADILLKDAGGNPLRKANFVNDIADTIARIPDPVKRSVYVNAAADKFGVDSSIIFSRVRNTRERLLEEERRTREREARNAAYEAASAPAPAGGTAETAAPSSSSYVPENRILAAIEQQILSFLLIHGSDQMVFDTDSKFYDRDYTPTVAEFIGNVVDSSGEPFANSVYQDVYSMYMSAYDAGVEQDEILRTLLNSPDRRVAGVAADLCTSRYQLSKTLESTLMATESWLVHYVPKAMFTLAERRLFHKLDTLRRELRQAGPEESGEIMKKMVELQKQHKDIKDKLQKEEFK